MFTSTQTQYDGARAPAVAGNGGASVLSNLASGAFGMLSAGGIPAISAAMDVAKEGTTTQTAGGGTNSQSTGSKSFGTPAGGDGIAANSFWQSTVKNTGSGSFNLYMIFGLVALVAWLALRRK